MSVMKLCVHAGPHSRYACPVSIPVDLANGISSSRIILTDTHTNRILPGQCMTEDGATALTWVVDHLAAGEDRVYTAHFGEGATSDTDGSGVEIAQVSDEQVDIMIAGQIFTSYHCGQHLARPYCYPLNDPLGSCVTRANAGEKAGETTDHVHHRSLWTAYGEVNETDNWSELPGYGRTVHRKFDRIDGGAVFGCLRAVGDWTTLEGDVLLHEIRAFRVYDVGDHPIRVFDVDLMLQATNGDVHFGDTKEGGFLSVRVATTMDASGDGKIENSYGAISEDECWGRRAYWCDYSGPVDGHQAGIAVMEHPDTFRSPTYWHVRNYGLMGTNPFGTGAFRGDPQLSGAYTLPHGERLIFSYRVVVHTGDAGEARIADHYHQYINPPQVTMEE